jgi:ABC-type transport system involved in Fe-S cluster assembly fused permease/ATPase subunit
MQPLWAQRAALIITHRLIGLEAADEIIVLDRGRIAERGTHAALMLIDGPYRRLWELQTQSLDA